MFLIDGKKIAAEWRAELTGKRPSKWPVNLHLIQVGEDPVTLTCIKQKVVTGGKLGVNVVTEKYPENISATDLESEVARISDRPSVDGVVVQLPLNQIADDRPILDAVCPEKDPDALGRASKARSPVVLAVNEVFCRAGVDHRAGRVLVIGQGRLVGSPVTYWLREELGLAVDVADEYTKDLRSLTQKADVIISGAGSPGLIKPEMVKDGVGLIDVGTTEVKGTLQGDIDPACFSKASWATPVPGGVGPIMITMLFVNFWQLIEERSGGGVLELGDCRPER